MILGITSLEDVIDLSQPSLWYSAAAIIFNPLFWNIVARNEYHKKTITRLCGGNRYIGCYTLAATIFSLGLVRDGLYTKALQQQPIVKFFPEPFNVFVPAALALYGQILVVSSMWALGLTGTFLGDYFGILLEKKVTAYPFSDLDDPMYVGSTITFAAGALWNQRPAGLILTGLVWIVYSIALRFEGPFTTAIYAKREKERALKSQKSK